MDIAPLLSALLAETDVTQAALAERLGVTQTTVSRWLSGAEPRGDKRDAIRAMAAAAGLVEPTARNAVPVMGYIGAGGEIAPEYEQVPPEGLDQIELPFAVPDDMIAFQVKGDSMLPKYSDGDAVVVPREQGRSTDSMIGDEAAVRVHQEDGSRRYLKRIMPGRKRGAFNLESMNAPTMLDARIAWASEVFAMVPARRLRKIVKRARVPTRSRSQVNRDR